MDYGGRNCRKANSQVDSRGDKLSVIQAAATSFGYISLKSEQERALEADIEHLFFLS